MFPELLRLELRRSAAAEVAGLHRAAAGWFAGRGYPVEAIRHAQAAGDWGLAAGLLADHWPGLHLDGQDTIVHELFAGFPAGARAADAELAGLAAADELARGSLETAERYLEQGVVLARRVGRPFLEFSGLAELAMTEHGGPFTRTAGIGRQYARPAEHARQAIEYDLADPGIPA